MGIELPPQPNAIFHHLTGTTQGKQLDLSVYNQASANMSTVSDVRLHEVKHRRMTGIEESFAFDFTKDPLDMQRSQELSLKVTSVGTIHAIAFWFTMQLGAGQQINTSPDTVDGPRSHWKQAVQILQNPIQASAGEVLKFLVAHSPSRITFRHLPKA